MKNRELMRLNKVLHKGEVKTIDCISPGYVSFIEDVPKDADFGPWVDLDEVEFVTLSEEWLVRLGFDFVAELQAYADKNHYIAPFHDGTFQFHPFCTNDEDCWKTLQYVHQLQNLYFALTGKELEYNAL